MQAETYTNQVYARKCLKNESQLGKRKKNAEKIAPSLGNAKQMRKKCSQPRKCEKNAKKMRKKCETNAKKMRKKCEKNA